MNAAEKKAIYDLHRTCLEAVEYVGSANYREREQAAKTAVSRAFTAFAAGRWDEVSQDIDKIHEEQEGQGE
jgi:hypothetical protein